MRLLFLIPTLTWLLCVGLLSNEPDAGAVRLVRTEGCIGRPQNTAETELATSWGALGRLRDFSHLTITHHELAEPLGHTQDFRTEHSTELGRTGLQLHITGSGLKHCHWGMLWIRPSSANAGC